MHMVFDDMTGTHWHSNFGQFVLFHAKQSGKSEILYRCTEKSMAIQAVGLRDIHRFQSDPF